MDLKTMRRKVRAGQYKTLQEMRNDCELMSKNALLFNRAPGEVSTAIVAGQGRTGEYVNYCWFIVAIVWSGVLLGVETHLWSVACSMCGRCHTGRAVPIFRARYLPTMRRATISAGLGSDGKINLVGGLPKTCRLALAPPSVRIYIYVYVVRQPSTFVYCTPSRHMLQTYKQTVPQQSSGLLQDHADRLG